MRQWPRASLLVVFFSFCGIASATAAFGCHVSDPDFSAAYRGDTTTDVNLDLNDYGRIEADADDPECAKAALFALQAKLANSLKSSPNAFRRWLDSYNIALIMGAVNRLGNQGWAMAGACPDPDDPTLLDENTPLDCLLDLVTVRFESGVALPEGSLPGGSPCGVEVYPANNCMDDRAGDASAYAWIAAYRAGRG